MLQTHNTALQRPYVSAVHGNPFIIAQYLGGQPDIVFEERHVNGKMRVIGIPNPAMRRLHERFAQYLTEIIRHMGADNYTLLRLPSSRAFVKGSNPLKNAIVHERGKFFYITDLKDAYPSVDLTRLARLIVYIQKFAVYQSDFSLRLLAASHNAEEVLTDDPLYEYMLSFLETFFSGPFGRGLAVGGPLSPYLFNLNAEVFMDMHLRRLCERYDVTYTRYADDLVFSRKKPVISDYRKMFRECITCAGFTVNHAKSWVRSREMGTVFVTKFGLRDTRVSTTKLRAVVTFPQKKRRKLHGMLWGYITKWTDSPEKVCGYMGEFMYYYKNQENPTKTDKRTLKLCWKFLKEWGKHKK